MNVIYCTVSKDNVNREEKKRERERERETATMRGHSDPFVQTR